MYSVLWNRLIWQNSHDSQWFCLGWTSLTYPGCTARGFLLMHAAGCYSVGQVDTFLAKGRTSDKAACQPHMKSL